MADNSGLLRRISWRDLCPWLIIFRSFGLAISGPILLLATAAVLLTPLGWQIADVLFVDDDSVLVGDAEDRNEWQRPFGADAGFLRAREVGNVLDASVFGEVYRRLVWPFRRLFDHDLTLSDFAYLLFGGLWTLLLWAFFGGAITRYAIVQLGREERVTLRESVSHSLRRYPSYFAAPLFPLLGVALLAIPIALLGLLLRFDVGVLIAGVLWLLVLVGAFLMAVLLLGLLFGWPLMWAAISAESSDAFDALSRSYAYTFQKPLYYLWCAVVAAFFGLLAATLVTLFAVAVVNLGFWAASWGAGHQTIDDVRFAVLQGGSLGDGAEAGGLWMLRLWTGLVWSIAVAFGYAFFWCAVSAIYLLLRQAADHTEMDEIYLEEEHEPYSLPSIAPEEKSSPPPANEESAPSEPKEV